MKRLIAVTGSILLICLIISAAGERKPIKADSPAAEQSAAGNESSSSETGISGSGSSYYYLRGYNKRVAVFEGESSEPLYITSRFVSDLPQDDQKLLAKGILAADKKTLKKLIQDFCS